MWVILGWYRKYIRDEHDNDVVTAIIEKSRVLGVAFTGVDIAKLKKEHLHYKGHHYFDYSVLKFPNPKGTYLDLLKRMRF